MYLKDCICNNRIILISESYLPIIFILWKIARDIKKKGLWGRWVLSHCGRKAGDVSQVGKLEQVWSVGFISSPIASEVPGGGGGEWGAGI